MTQKYMPQAKYLLQYHSLETGKTEMMQFRRFFGTIRFLLGPGRPALLSGRYQILTVEARI